MSKNYIYKYSGVKYKLVQSKYKHSCEGCAFVSKGCNNQQNKICSINYVFKKIMSN